MGRKVPKHQPRGLLTPLSMEQTNYRPHNLSKMSKLPFSTTLVNFECLEELARVKALTLANSCCQTRSICIETFWLIFSSRKASLSFLLLFLLISLQIAHCIGKPMVCVSTFMGIPFDLRHFSHPKVAMFDTR